MAQSFNSRLTINQKYIYTSILNLFSEDVKENFILMLTFCDGAKPPIVNTLEDPNSVLNQLISCIEKPWYYKFNNSAIFTDKVEEEPFTRMFFEINMKSFEEFKQRLIKMPKKSLIQTKQVLEERNKLEKYSEILTKKLNEGIDKVNHIKELLNTKSKSYNIQLIKEAKNELINLNNECINTEDLIIKSINRLEQIALNKNWFESQEDYIELLIADEKCEQRPGY